MHEQTDKAPDEVRARIVGYRQLSQEEQGAINELKALAETVGQKVDVVRGMEGADQRWCSIAQTNPQQGFMALIRAIARPTTF